MPAEAKSEMFRTIQKETAALEPLLIASFRYGALKAYDINPTAETYAALQQAHDFFNERLFEGELPHCLMTLQRRRRAFGFFAGGLWQATESDVKADEIALNPAHLMHRSIEETLSTLVHEMVHEWQHHFGKSSRSGYHNKEWAAKMIDVGLMPTNTGGPGGKLTGQSMTHLIIEDGPFIRACRELIDQRGFKFPFVERSQNELERPLKEPAEPTDPSKTKYHCQSCETNVWGKPDLRLLCLDCDKPFVVAQAAKDRVVPALIGAVKLVDIDAYIRSTKSSGRRT